MPTCSAGRAGRARPPWRASSPRRSLCQGAEAARTTGASGCMACGTCPECEAIAAGTHPDVYELDAASRTGVDNVREEIIGSVNFAPVRGAYKVYIIDEVHMLTAAAFNALLKTLEEPPSHVVFVLCTTDPQKILETILSRCQPSTSTASRTRTSSAGCAGSASRRASPTTTRRSRWWRAMPAAACATPVDPGAALGVRGRLRARRRRAVTSGRGLRHGALRLRLRDRRARRGRAVRPGARAGGGRKRPHGVHARRRGAVRDVYTACVAGDRPELFDGTPEEVASLVEEARLFEGPDRLARVLTVLDDAAIEMRSASDPRLVLEIALTRLARPQSDLTLEALAERLDRLEAQVAAGVASAPMDAAGLTGASGAAAASRAASPSKPESAHGAPAPAAPAAPVHDRAGLPWNASRPAGGAAAQPSPAAPAAAAPAPASVSGSASGQRPDRPSPAAPATDSRPAAGPGTASIPPPASSVAPPPRRPPCPLRGEPPLRWPPPRRPSPRHPSRPRRPVLPPRPWKPETCSADGPKWSSASPPPSPLAPVCCSMRARPSTTATGSWWAFPPGRASRSRCSVAPIPIRSSTRSSARCSARARF